MPTTGRLSGVPPMLPKNRALPKVNTPPSAASSQYPPTPPLGWPLTANQSDLSPSLASKPSPVSVAVPELPAIVICSTRPPRSPSPLRCVTVMAVSVPIWG